MVEFYAQVNTLICSNCYGRGHFSKSCPQKDEATCKTCGDKLANLKDHDCSDISKCIHCGEGHVSNDSKYKIIQQYRAMLSRSLLDNAAPTNLVDSGRDLLEDNKLQSHTTTTTNRISYGSVLKTAFSNSNSEERIARRLDSILSKVEEESNATRQSLIEFKQEVRSS